jgi:hypothetical protein
VIFAGALWLLIPFAIVLPGIMSYQLYAGRMESPDEAFPTLIRNLVPAGLRGFMLAAIAGAVISSLASMLNSASTIFTMDVYNRMLDRRASQRRLLLLGRVTTAVFVVIGCLLAPRLADPKFGGVFQYIQEFQGYIWPGVVAAFVFGMLAPQAPGSAGVAALIGGPAIYWLFQRFAPGLHFLIQVGVTFELVLAIMGLITFVIPQFAKVYAKVKVELPFPTRVCLVLSKLFNEQWPVLLLVLLAGALAVFLILRTAWGRYAWDRLKLHVPLIGPLLLKSALSRLARIFSLLHAAGGGSLDAQKILSGTIGNAAISRELEGVQVHLEQGHGVARPLMAAKYFTPMLINMVAVGEEAGNLDEMLREVSLHYDSEVEYATRRLTTAMGPVLIVAMAFLVGFFALAVYMPMWDLAKLATRQ